MNCTDDKDFNWRVVTQDEAAAVHALHAGVFARTPAGMVRPDDLEHFERHSEALGRILGCFADGELVAYGVLGMHSHTAEHLADLLELAPADRARICVLDGAASLPEWRGRSLHCAAIAERCALGRSLGRTLVAATVAPENMRSLRGLLKEGFTIHRYAIVYGGLARLIVQRDLLAPAPQWQLASRVPVPDHPGHQSALAAGLVGYDCWQDEDKTWHIDYGVQAKLIRPPV
jgi:hypothetical protein